MRLRVCVIAVAVHGRLAGGVGGSRVRLMAVGVLVSLAVLVLFNKIDAVVWLLLCEYSLITLSHLFIIYYEMN